MGNKTATFVVLALDLNTSGATQVLATATAALNVQFVNPSTGNDAIYVGDTSTVATATGIPVSAGKDYSVSPSQYQNPRGGDADPITVDLSQLFVKGQATTTSDCLVAYIASPEA